MKVPDGSREWAMLAWANSRVSDGQAGMSKERDSADCECWRRLREHQRCGAIGFHEWWCLRQQACPFSYSSALHLLARSQWTRSFGRPPYEDLVPKALMKTSFQRTLDPKSSQGWSVTFIKVLCNRCPACQSEHLCFAAAVLDHYFYFISYIWYFIFNNVSISCFYNRTERCNCQ